MAQTRTRVMIVEDEQSLLSLETIILSSRGFDVSACADGSTALEKLGRERHDLVILDIMLPDIDGFEVCRRIRSNPATAAIPVIMLTARKNSADHERGLAAGANAYMTKPFKTAQLVETIAAVLASAAKRDQ